MDSPDKLQASGSKGSEKLTLGSEIQELASEEDQSSSHSVSDSESKASDKDTDEVGDDSFYDSESDNSFKMQLAEKLREQREAIAELEGKMKKFESLMAKKSDDINTKLDTNL